MNDLLRDTFHEQADRLPAPAINLALIESTGRRRRNRRRAGITGVTVAGIAVVGFGASQLGTNTPDSDSNQSPVAAALRNQTPTWATGSTVHLGNDLSTDVGHQVDILVRTQYGVVFTDPQHTVWFSDGEKPSVKVGATGSAFIQMRAATQVVAWTERSGNKSFITAMDTATGQVTRTPAQAKDNGEFEGAVVNAVDNDTVWFSDDRGIFSWIPGNNPVRVSDSKDFELIDVAAGRYLTNPADSGSKGRVGTTLGQGTPVGASGVQRLSPDGSLLLSESSADEFALYDTASGKVIGTRPDGYSFMVGFAWSDPTHYWALGIAGAEPQGEEQPKYNLMMCDTKQQCDVVLADTRIEGKSRVVLPIGIAVD